MTMRKGLQSVLSASAVATAVLLGGCRSVASKQGTPVAQPPHRSAPAEKVDDNRGFKEATPSDSASPSDRAEVLNAQGALKSIHFDFDKADLGPEARGVLGQDLKHILQESALKVVIEGYCDERGTVEYNLALGDLRARAARDFLIAQGVSQERFRTISYGKEKPLDPGHDEAAWAKNRRDDLVFASD
jgi:peptidoglycan-associated lipoprotein